MVFLPQGWVSLVQGTLQPSLSCSLMLLQHLIPCCVEVRQARGCFYCPRLWSPDQLSHGQACRGPSALLLSTWALLFAWLLSALVFPPYLRCKIWDSQLGWQGRGKGGHSVSFCYQANLGSAHLMCSRANLPIPGCGKGKCSIYCKAFSVGPSKENRQLRLKRPKLPDGFQGRVFKDKVRERVAGCLISSWTFFFLVSGEVTW